MGPPGPRLARACALVVPRLTPSNDVKGTIRATLGFGTGDPAPGGSGAPPGFKWMTGAADDCRDAGA